MRLIQLVASLCFLTVSVTGVVLKINGWLDYEPNTNVLRNLVSKLSQISKLEGSLDTAKNKNEFDEDNNKDELLKFKSKITKVKDNQDVVDFIHSVYNKSLAVLRRVALRTDESMQPKVEEMTNEFKVKFEAFMNKSMDQIIGTKLAIKKITINTIKFTKSVMERLLNNLTSNMKEKISPITMRHSVKKIHHEIQQHLNETRGQLCKKFGFCNQPKGYIEFLVSVLDIVANSQKSLTRVAVNLFIKETLNNDTANALSENEFKKINKIAHSVQNKNPMEVKGILRHLVHNLLVRYKPMVLQKRSDLVNGQQAFYEIMDTLEENIKPTEENTEVWDDIKKRLITWAATRSGDITDIVKDFVRHTRDKGIRTMSGYQWVNLKQNLRTIINDKER